MPSSPARLLSKRGSEAGIVAVGARRAAMTRLEIMCRASVLAGRGDGERSRLVISM